MEMKKEAGDRFVKVNFVNLINSERLLLARDFIFFINKRIGPLDVRVSINVLSNNSSYLKLQNYIWSYQATWIMNCSCWLYLYMQA
jgi:hypothetical protein